MATKKKTVYIDGEVCNCSRLNIRRNPTLDSDVVSIVDAGVKIRIDKAIPLPGWSHVITEDGVEGYCIYKYVTGVTGDE